MLSLRRSLSVFLTNKVVPIPTSSSFVFVFRGRTPVPTNSVLSAEIHRSNNHYPNGVNHYTTDTSRTNERKGSSSSGNSSSFRRWNGRRNNERSAPESTSSSSLSSSSSPVDSSTWSSSTRSFTPPHRSSRPIDRSRTLSKRRTIDTPLPPSSSSSSVSPSSLASPITPFASREPMTTKEVQKLASFPPPRPRIKPVHHPGHPKGVGGVLQTLNPTDANIARELNKLTTVNDILQHHRQHMNDYDTVNLSTAVQKVLSVSGNIQPWKRDIVAAQDFQSLTAHTVSSLRHNIKTDADTYPQIIDLQKRIRKGDHEAQKELATLKQLHPPLQIRTVASTVYALSKVNACPPSLLHEIGYVLTKRDSTEDHRDTTVSAPKPNYLGLEKASPIDISMLAYAYSRSNIRAPQLFNRLGKRIMTDIENYKEKELSSIALSYTSLQTAAPQLFQKIAERLAARREQTDTVTPQVLANMITSLARSIDLDKKLPDRLQTDNSADNTTENVQSHAQTTASTLHILAERVSRTARKYRVPLISPHAFTAQGLASTAWSYAHVYNASLSSIVHQPSQVQNLGTRILNRVHERITELTARTDLIQSIEYLEQMRKELSLGYTIQVVTSCHNSYAAPWINTLKDKDEVNERTQRMEAVRAQEASTVRVLQDTGQAFMHPQTISTATGAQLAIMGRAQADISLGLLARLSLITKLREDVESIIRTKKDEIRNLTVTNTEQRTSDHPQDLAKLSTQLDLYRSILEVTVNEHQRLDTLIKQLNVQEIIAACARAAVRILDPASGGDDQSVRAEIAKEDVFRNDAKEKTVKKLATDMRSEEAIENAIVLRRKSSLALRSPAAKQEEALIQNAWLRETEEEVNEEFKEATNLLRTLDERKNNGTIEEENEETVSIDTPNGTVNHRNGSSKVQDNYQSLLADLSNPSSSRTALRYPNSAVNDKNNEDDIVPEPNDTNPLNKQLRYNPLRYNQSVALATPVSLFDCAQLCSAVADTLVDEPEFWSKIADRIVRGRRGTQTDGAKEKAVPDRTANDLSSSLSRTNATLGTNAKGPERRRLMDGIEDSIRDMRPYDAAVLAYSTSLIAPDIYANRILQAIAMVFAEEDLMLQLGDRVQPLSNLQKKNNFHPDERTVSTVVRKSVDGSIPNALLSSGDTSQEEDNIALLEAQQDPHRYALRTGAKNSNDGSSTPSPSTTDPDAPLPSFDEEPTWRDDEEEAIRRSRSFMKPPAKGVFKLRGDNTGNLGNPVVTYGEENTEIGSPEKLNVYQGTLNTWTSRLIHRAKVDTQFKLFTAYALVLPPVTKPVTVPVDGASSDEKTIAWLQYYATALRAESGKALLHQLLPASWNYYTHLYRWNKRNGTINNENDTANTKPLHLHRSVQTTLSKGRIFSRGIVMKEPQFTHATGFDSILAWRHLMSEVGSRISDRTRELSHTETGLFTLLLTTRSMDRIEQLKDSSWQPVLRGARPINEAPLRRIARRIVEDTNNQKSFVSEGSLAVNDATGKGTVSFVHQDFTAFMQITRAFGFALRDSLRNHDEIFDKTLIQNQNILRSLILFLDESAKYLEIVNPKRTDTFFTVHPVTKTKTFVSAFQWSIELAVALSHIIVTPSGIDRFPSSLPGNLQQQIQSVRSIAGRWVKAIIDQMETLSTVPAVTTEIEQILSNDEETAIKIQQIMRMKPLVVPETEEKAVKMRSKIEG